MPRKLGCCMKQALEFIANVNGWHSFDFTVKDSIQRLEARGLVDAVYYTHDGQFKITDAGRIYLSKGGN